VFRTDGVPEVLGRRLSQAALPAAVAVLAFTARLVPVLHGGGLTGLAGYDDGVYFSAADAVSTGQVPYRDFVLLHPPALVYLLTPFALLGHVIGDANGWAVARLAMMAVGGVSAALVVLVLRRFGPVAAVGGGLLYAGWPPAIGGEASTWLECVPNALLLLALLVLGSSRRAERPAYQLLAGAALGLGMCTKIWGVVPLLVVVGWQLVTGGWRRAGKVLAGSALAAVAVCGPAFALAPSRMFVYVVSDQLQRSHAHTSIVLRAAYFTPVHRLLPQASTARLWVVVGAVAALGAGAAVLAWQQRRARVFVALLLAQGAVLCGSPPYFPHYGAFLAPAVALTAGVAAQQVAHLTRSRSHPTRLERVAHQARRPALAILGLLVVVAAAPVLSMRITTPFPTARVAGLLSGDRCVQSDSPGALALAGVLTRDLEWHCGTRIDVSGPTYNTEAEVSANGRSVPRIHNLRWQRDLMSYLMSGQAAIVTRKSADEMDPQSLAQLRRLRLLYHGDGLAVYAVPH
jgi:alpha-1,2-mannosyltransferase